MPLPRLPLNALRAFETTVRLGSMSAAASRTRCHAWRRQPAYPGVGGRNSACRSCFDCRSPSLPTPAGSQLAVNLATGVRAHASRRGAPRTGAVDPVVLRDHRDELAHPRLRTFKRDNPSIEVRLNINYGELDFVRDEVSLAIRSSMFRAPEGVIVRPLLHEEIGPICHPDYAARLELDKPEDLSGSTGCSARRPALPPGPNGWPRSADRTSTFARMRATSTSIC